MSVAYPFAPVRAGSAGGAEQVLHMLDAAIVRAGNRSIVIAQEGSEVEGELIAMPSPTGVIDEKARRRAHSAFKAAIGKALKGQAIDIVHMHGLDFRSYLPEPGVPVLVTLHLPLEWYGKDAFSLLRPGTYFNCVSGSQRRAMHGFESIPLIENGVPVERLRLKAAKRSFAISIGRVCPEKGFHIAADAAREADIPLIIAGEVYPYPEHERYFREVLAPKLGKGCRFIGPVGFERKRRLLSAARCLIVPSLVPETSSLVAMEALACGTPVVANSIGALEEIIEHGRTGFLVKNTDDMAKAINDAKGISPEVCMAEARKRFSSAVMAAKYIEAYKKICMRKP